METNKQDNFEPVIPMRKSNFNRLLNERFKQGQSQGYQEGLKQRVTGYISIEKVEEIINNIENPYPEDIFPKVDFYQLEQVKELCNNLGFPLDRLSAELMRRARETLKEELLNKIRELQNDTR